VLPAGASAKIGEACRESGLIDMVTDPTGIACCVPAQRAQPTGSAAK
jgi:hypothetical protein